MHRPRFHIPLVAGATLSVAAALSLQPLAGAQAAPGGGAQSPETMIVLLAAACPAPATTSSSGAPTSTTSGTCAAQSPVIAQLQADGASVLSTSTLVDTITASMTPAVAQSIAAYPGVSQVIPDSPIAMAPTPSLQPLPASAPTAASNAAPAASGGSRTVQDCGTQTHPELDPEALQAIDAPAAWQQGDDGSGVTVALLADGLDPSNPDFQRNPAFGAPGTPVITQYQDFSGDGTNAPTEGGEAFLDASSIAAQGNDSYNLAQYVSPQQAARLPSGGCWIRIVGAAPGADVLALKVFAQNDQTTTSGFLQAIQYAVEHGAKVVNESFGSNNFPDTSLDVVRDADEAAVAAGVTVVASSGDGGQNSTIGSPATDPAVIDVGATTTFRAYAQDDDGGFDNPAVGNGRFVDNNISDLSSGGFDQSGGTVDLVAPGDLNWALCSADTAMYSSCTNESGAPSDIELSGGTSEAAPLTAAAAADVIEAYATNHHGADPSPALVKQILTSTATDIDAPATEQGAGLLDVSAAVRLAASLRAPGSPPPGRHQHGAPVQGGGLLVNPGQVNLSGAPGTALAAQISLTNSGDSAEHVSLATRALTDKVADSGVQTFTMDPSNPTTNSGTMPIWSGVTEVYQTETFSVPRTNRAEPSRLVFTADYQYTGQSSLLHVALFEPDGTYAAYSLPQGLADYADVEVTDPPPGTWTALFFTEQDGATPGAVGTSGPVQWDASTWQDAPAGAITPSQLIVAPGATATATLHLVAPSTAGDSAQSIVVSAPGQATTIPVTVRTTVPLGANGGTFSGVLTGGNGRAGTEAQSNTYVFDVPPGEHDLDASVALANDPGEDLVGFLVDPSGQTEAYSTNYTLVPTAAGLAPGATQYVELYHLAPVPGQWELILQWANPVTGNELAEPFDGAIRFNQVSVSSDLPDSASDTLAGSSAASFAVHVENTGVAPEAYFVDPRLDSESTLTLDNQNPDVNASSLTLPLPAPTTADTFPYYLVPPQTTELEAGVQLTSPGVSQPTFDLSYFPGDPDVSPRQPAPGVVGSSTPSAASLSLTEPGEVSPGLWALIPDETGPYPPSGAPTETASASVQAVTQPFDTTVSSDTDDFWQASVDASYSFANVLYLEPGQSGSISVDITPSGKAGSVASGTLYVDDFTLASVFGAALPNGDELAALPYRYTVGTAKPVTTSVAGLATAAS